MKRLVFGILLLTFLFSAKSANAEGQACCSDPWKYDYSADDCVENILNPFNRKSIECNVGEACFAKHGLDFEGLCVKPENVGENCCPIGSYYDKDQDECLNFLTRNPVNMLCEEDQQCYSGTCINTSVDTHNIQIRKLCNSVQDRDAKAECVDCFMNKKGAWTAIGCIETESPEKFFNIFLKFGIGMAGGIAFLLILLGAFQMMTSSGNPEQLNAGKELVGSAITGLLLIIFSVFILRLIGFEILGLPGFG